MKALLIIKRDKKFIVQDNGNPFDCKVNGKQDVVRFIESLGYHYMYSDLYTLIDNYLVFDVQVSLRRRKYSVPKAKYMDKIPLKHPIIVKLKAMSRI